jgi:uncharacterized protein
MAFLSHSCYGEIVLGNTADFYSLFSTAASQLSEATDLLAELVIAKAADRPALARKMNDYEHAGDETTHQIMYALNSSLVTPFDREDVHRLADHLDDVMDFMEAAADLIVLYKIDKLPAETRAMTDVLCQMGKLTARALSQLQSLENVELYLIDIHGLEKKADGVHRRLVSDLFNNSHEPILVIKLKEIIDQLEAAADAFEHVANTFESILIKEQPSNFQ